jgi:putative N-acetyltransferase (TIGR04045 family)
VTAVSVPTSRLSATASQPAAGPQLACRPAASAAELAAHFRIRHQVFVLEQGLFGAGPAGPRDGLAGEERPAGDDLDAHDDDLATIHVIGLADGVIGGTVRLYPLDSAQGRWKGDRLAVLAEHRRHGLGGPLVRFAVAEAGARGGLEMEAFIQPANVAFFEWLGWRRAGGIVAYAGIDHQRMVTGLAGRGQPGWPS